MQQFSISEGIEMISKIKKMVKQSDFFHSSEMLRYQDQLEYNTLTGGILSLTIIIIIFVGFASMIFQTLDLSVITTSVDVIKNVDPTLSVLSTHPDSNFMFAVQIWHVNITGPLRYFDVVFTHQVFEGQNLVNFTYLSLQPCTREHWKFMPEVQTNYESLNINNWMCPPIGQEYQLYGKYSSKSQSNFALSVMGCNNYTDPTRPCASQAEIDQLFTSFTSKFFFTLYYSNPIINSGQKDYKSYYLQDQNYVMFGDKVGSEMYVRFTDYTINTDNSIWPFESSSTDQGIMVQTLSVNHPYQAIKDGVYANILIAKSANSITYTRQVQKISSVFSFIGGMVSAISALMFFIKIYTNLSYELSIAHSIFQPQSKEKQGEESTLTVNFMTFLRYYAFEFGKLLGFTMEWPSLKYISECQTEIVKQLDVKLLIKRIVFIEHCLTYLFEDYQFDGLQMKTPKTPHQIKEIREKCESVIEKIATEFAIVHANKSGQNIAGQVIRNIQIPSNPNLLGSPSMFSGDVHQQKLNSMFLHQQNLVIMEMTSNDMNSGISKPSSNSGAKRNNVFNDYQKEKVRELNMQVLCLNAEEGNELSKKIWNSLSAEKKEKTAQLQENKQKFYNINTRKEF